LHIVYVDEQDDERQRYSSYTACAFNTDKMHDYKISLFKGLREIFERADDDARPFPILHANALPAELDDRNKANLCKLFCELISKNCSLVYRVDYSWDHAKVARGLLPSFESRQLNARLLSLATLQHDVWQKLDGLVLFVYELDIQNVRRFEQFYNYSQHAETSWQLELLTGEAAYSIPSRVIGSLYCNKKDHFIYAADFASYQLYLLGKPSLSAFQLSCRGSERFQHLVFRNEIIVA
jgi:hypothetical protein